MNQDLVLAESLLAGRKAQMAIDRAVQAAKREMRKDRRVQAQLLKAATPGRPRYRRKRV